MECPDGKLYPFSVIILYILGLSLLNINFKMLFKRYDDTKLIIINNGIFLFLIIINNRIVKDTKNIALDKFVNILTIGVMLSLIKLLDISKYTLSSKKLVVVVFINTTNDINNIRLIIIIVFLFLVTISLPNIYYNT